MKYLMLAALVAASGCVRESAEFSDSEARVCSELKIKATAAIFDCARRDYRELCVRDELAMFAAQALSYLGRDKAKLCALELEQSFRPIPAPAP